MPEQEHVPAEQGAAESDNETDRVLRGIFSGLDPEARANTMKKKIGIFVRKGILPETALSEVDRLSQETDKEAFIKGVKTLAAPMLAFKMQDPAGYEALAREQVLEEEDWEAINQLVAYEDALEGDWRLHILPNQSTPNSKKMELLREALEKLAARIKERPEITGLEGTSWIVPRAPRVLQNLGFELVGEIPDEIRQAHFASEQREVQRARMSRETLIEKYGKEGGRII